MVPQDPMGKRDRGTRELKLAELVSGMDVGRALRAAWGDLQCGVAELLLLAHTQQLAVYGIYRTYQCSQPLPLHLYLKSEHATCGMGTKCRRTALGNVVLLFGSMPSATMMGVGSRTCWPTSWVCQRVCRMFMWRLGQAKHHDSAVTDA